MSTLYELYNKRTRYKNVRENVSNAINVLSRNNSVDDSISSLEGLLGSNYLVDETICNGAYLRNIRESVVKDLGNLNTCLSSVNSKIYSLNKEIDEMEAQGMS